MPLDLSKYKKTSKSVSVAVGEDTLRVSYKPAAFTPNLRKEINKLGEDDVDALAKYIHPLLASWDLTDAEKPVPITVETLNSLGYALLNSVFTAIIADINPTAPTPNDPNARKG